MPTLHWIFGFALGTNDPRILDFIACPLLRPQHHCNQPSAFTRGTTEGQAHLVIIKIGASDFLLIELFGVFP